MIEQNCIDHKNINDMNSMNKNNNNNSIIQKSKDIFNTPERKIFINEKKIQNQHKIIIEDVEIFFPYKPYEIQEIYMQKIIQNLNKKCTSKTTKDLEFNSLVALESPTGTGKTLCLLCSVLGWVCYMRKQNKYLGSIIYSTRTHSQISQIIIELNKTCYQPNIAILSSREYSCINQELKKSFDASVLDIKCAKEHRKCMFYKNSEFYSNLDLGCVDIEDIIKKGKANLFCPFYCQRMKVRKEICDIIFMPYNYIFLKEIRDTMEIKLQNNIIIIDEAHNVTKNCEEAKSVEVNNNDFKEMLKDLKEIIKEKKKQLNINELDEKDEEEESEENDKEKKEDENQSKNKINYLSTDYLLKEIDVIKKIMNNLKERQENINLINKEINSKDFLSIFITSEEKINEINSKENKKQKTIESFFNKKNFEEEKNDEINKISKYITEKNIQKHISFLEKVIKAVLQDYSKRTKLSILFNILERIKDYLNDEDILKSYTFYLSEKKIQTNIKQIKNIINLNIFCFNPGLGFHDILKFKPYSIILTSGTLAPFDILEEELKIKFDTILEGDNIVDKSQIKFAIIKGIQTQNKNLYFNFEYNKRSDLKTIASLGITILNLCKTVKSGGVIVFFTSFAYLNECYNIWGESNIISRISQIKTIFFDNKTNKNLITDYKNNKNSILFSVFRGSSSEGIDYKDDMARMVICVGVPYASITEQKIQLKKKYLDKISKEKNDCRLNGKKWYINDAISNVNQTLGRVIRHKEDYGALICIDQRYETHYKQNLFSKWIRDKCTIIDILDDTFLNNLVEFFDEQNKIFDKLKNENTINHRDTKPLNLNKEENQQTNNSNQMQNKNKFDNIFKREKKHVKYEYEEETNSNLNNNTDNNNKINNEIINEKEFINDLEKKYLKNENSNNLQHNELLSKKTKLKITEYDYDYNNEDVNPNQINTIKKSKKINCLEKYYYENYNNQKSDIKNNIINKNKKNDDLNNILDEMNKYDNELDSKKNDLSNKKIEQMINNLNNNTYIEYFDKKELFCVVCFQTLNEDSTLTYSKSKCKHILCNICWARALYEKYECPVCKKKVREKTLIRLIPNP